MAFHQFDLSTLRQLDGGRVAEAFLHAIKRAALDCEDRPGEERARKVSLQAEITPQTRLEEEPDGRMKTVFDGVDVKFQIKDALPTRLSRKYSMGVKHNGSVYFNADSPHDHRQATFFDGEKPEDESEIAAEEAEVQEPAE